MEEGKSIQAEKMKNYKRAHHHQFLYNLILYSLTSLITCFFFSHPLWSPSLKHLLFSLPTINISYLSNPKSLFIIANVIVFILIAESKLARRSSPASDIYDEYIARSRQSRSHKVNSSDDVVKKENEEETNNIRHGRILVVCDEEIKKKEMRRVSRSMHHRHRHRHRHHHKEEKKGIMRVSKSEVWGESDEIVKIEKQQEEESAQICAVANNEELNKRVEAFIARVKKQRLLEAKLVLALDHNATTPS